MTFAPLRGIRAAFVFLTRLPLGGFPYQDADWRWASAFFPAVGLALGLVAAGVHALLVPYGAVFAATSAVAVIILVTGAFHEDGLADSADALGGGLEPRERVLEILKDSRLGTYGTTALVLSILFRVVIITELGGGEAADSRWLPGLGALTDAGWALVCAHVLARVGPVFLMATLSYATSDAHSKSRHLLGTTWKQAVCAALWGAIILAIAPISIGAILALTLSLAGFTFWFGRRCLARVEGITGDFLGALEQVGEVIVLSVFLLAASHG